MTIDLKEARRLAWELAGYSNEAKDHLNLLEETAENEPPTSGRQLAYRHELRRELFGRICNFSQSANLIRDLCDEVERQQFLNTAMKAMWEHSPDFAEALERSARAAGFWKTGLLQTIADLERENRRLRERMKSLESDSNRILPNWLNRRDP